MVGTAIITSHNTLIHIGDSVSCDSGIHWLSTKATAAMALRILRNIRWILRSRRFFRCFSFFSIFIPHTKIHHVVALPFCWLLYKSTCYESRVTGKCNAAAAEKHKQMNKNRRKKNNKKKATTEQSESERILWLIASSASVAVAAPSMLPESVYTRRVESWYDARSLGATGPAQLM